MASDRLDLVLAAIDAYNCQDPNMELVGDVEQPHELLYSRRLSQWVERLQPNASEPLRIAARGQHVGRWTIPRAQYPMDRGGYLRWREDLKKFHATTVAGFMKEVGYSSDTIERVRTIILKKNLSADPDVQTLEDALCLVFLDTQFEDLQEKTPADKMVDIVRKTWNKMSAQGRREALALDMPDSQRRVIEQALAAASESEGRRAEGELR